MTDQKPQPTPMKRRLMPRIDAEGKALLCIADNCEKAVKARGLCDKHYWRQANNGHWSNISRASPGEPMKQVLDAVSSDTDSCILWEFGRRSGGYGSMQMGGVNVAAHRAVMILRDGGDRPEMSVLHGVCHNPACINPRHLKWGTHTENMADKLRDGTHNKGERSPVAKLDWASVEQIRSMFEAGEMSQTEIARSLGLHQSTVHCVVRRKTWNR